MRVVLRVQLANKFFTDNRMEQGFKPCALLGSLEDNGSQAGPVQRAILCQDIRTKMLGNGLKCRRAGLDHLAGDIVGIHPVNAQIAKHSHHR